MEIERKFLLRHLPERLDHYECLALEQAYLCTDPVVRVRRENQDFYLTYKGRGMMVRQEYNLPLNQEAYRHLLAKADGSVITKKRYRIPVPPYMAELDLFEGIFFRFSHCGGRISHREGGPGFPAPGMDGKGGHPGSPLPQQLPQQAGQP